MLAIDFVAGVVGVTAAAFATQLALFDRLDTDHPFADPSGARPTRCAVDAVAAQEALSAALFLLRLFI